MINKSVADLRSICEPGGKSARRAAEIVATIKSFPEILSELKNIADASGESAHRAAELVSHLINLPEWIDEQHGGLRDSAERELDRLCRMIALTADEMVAMIKFFPEARHWHRADLCKLRDSAIALQAAEDSERRARDRARREQERASATPGVQKREPGQKRVTVIARTDPAPTASEHDAVGDRETPTQDDLAFYRAEAERFRKAWERSEEKRKIAEAKCGRLQAEIAELRKQLSLVNVKHQQMSVEEFRALTGRGKPPKHKDVLQAPPRPSGPVDVTLELPLPPKALHPNSRNAHWAQRSRAAKQAREDAQLAAVAAGFGWLPTPATIHATFYLRRKMDDDGLVSWLKSYRDGLFAQDSQVMMLAPSVILVGKDDKPRVLLRVQSSPSKQPPIL
jgi:hypothetical protein